MARRLGAMELMVLLLQYPLTRCSVSVIYLPSAPSELRTRSVKPMYITYPDYFRHYNIGSRRPGQRSKLFHAVDRKGRIIIQRKSPILLRFTNYSVQDGEPFFFQHLIMKIHARSEHELLDGNTTYRDRFRALFPAKYNEAISSFRRSYTQERNSLSRAYDSTLRSLLPELETRSPLTLDTEQYRIYSRLCNVWGKSHEGKYPYFFLLLAFTGVAAQNAGGRTIHSRLKIRFHDGNFLSNTFARIHNNNLIFGGVPILVVGDLAQLPPIRPRYVFQSPAWRKFFPLFLTVPQRQQDDLEFYNVLQEIRTGHHLTIREMTQSLRSLKTC